MTSKHSRLFIVFFALLVISPYLTLGYRIQLDRPTLEKDFMLSAPIIDSPPDQTFENGSRGEEIRWNATDEDPKNFTITRDGEEYESGAWDGSELVVDLDHLYEENLTYAVPISFEFSCVVFNMENESASDSVIINVIADETAPIISAPDDFFYEEGSFGHEITWNLTESNPDFLNITLRSNETSGNESVVRAESWDGDNITINVDGLNASHWYLYTLFVNDTLGQNSTSSVNVTVFADLSSPTATSPDDISYEFGSTGHRLSWDIYDSNPRNYSVIVSVTYYNDSYGNVTEKRLPTNITVDDWSFTDPEGDIVDLPVDELYLGNYSYNLTIFDDFGRSISDAVNITVYEDIRAPIITTTGNFTYEEGYLGHFLNWTMEESNPRYYNLTRDGEILTNKSWRGENIFIEIDGLSVGDHIFNLTLWDFFNQSSVDIVTITVTPDAHDPIIAEIRVIQSFATPSSNNLSVQAYVWDINNIRNITIEWGMTLDNTNTKVMELQNEDFYLTLLGEYAHGSLVWYRLRAEDNSSVNLVTDTGWLVVDVVSMNPDITPPAVWVGILALGALSTLVILVIYFRTKTK